MKVCVKFILDLKNSLYFRVKWSANRLNTVTPCPKKMTFYNQTFLHNI